MVLLLQASEEWLRNAVLHRGCFMARASANDSWQLPVEDSVRCSQLFNHEIDSARQLQAHQRYLVELSVPAHVVLDLRLLSSRQLVAATP